MFHVSFSLLRLSAGLLIEENWYISVQEKRTILTYNDPMGRFIMYHVGVLPLISILLQNVMSKGKPVKRKMLPYTRNGARCCMVEDSRFSISSINVYKWRYTFQNGRNYFSVLRQTIANVNQFKSKTTSTAGIELAVNFLWIQ